MLVDLWGWFDEYEREAIKKGDSWRQRLVRVAHEGWRYRQLADGENAIRAFEEGLKLAKLLHEPCWEVFYQYWIAVIHLFTFYDYQSSLDNTVRLVAEIRKGQYQDCPIISRSIYLLAKIYILLDLFAYEEEVLSLLDYIEKEIGVDDDTHLQIPFKRAEIDYEHERYDLAQEKVQYLISLDINNNFRMYDVYQLLRKIAFARGDIVQALNYNQIAQKYAGLTMMQESIAYEKLWEAVLLKYHGDDAKARERYYLALAHFEQYTLPLENAYHLANALYLELDKQIEAAIKSHMALLQVVTTKPGISSQMEAYYAYITLLGRSGKDFSEPLAKAKAIAMTSSKPEAYLKRLGKIEGGDYFEFEWQKNSRENS